MGGVRGKLSRQVPSAVCPRAADPLPPGHGEWQSWEGEGEEGTPWALLVTPWNQQARNGPPKASVRMSRSKQTTALYTSRSQLCLCFLTCTLGGHSLSCLLLQHVERVTETFPARHAGVPGRSNPGLGPGERTSD